MLRASLALCTAAMATASCVYSACSAGAFRTVPQRQRYKAFSAVPRCIRLRRGRGLRTSTTSRPTSSLAMRQVSTEATKRAKGSTRLQPRRQTRATLVTIGDTTVAVDEPRRTRKTSVAVVAKISNGSDSGEAKSENENELERCKRLARELGVEVVLEDERSQPRKAREKSSKFRFTMLFDEKGRLGLGQPGSGFKSLVVDFSGGKNGHRAKQQPGTEQVVKAAALPKRRTENSSPSLEEDIARELGGYELEEPLLWDLTAGLGTDAFVLALAGWRVEMFERSPIVAALLQDALERAKASEDLIASSAASRMSLTVADGIDVATEVASSAASGGERGARYRAPAVVYLDPMFPQRKKTALVKKGMRMLQALVEEECECRERLEDESGESAREEEERRLFDAAMRLATCKVVVKRPVHGPEIVDHVAPSHSVVSKNGRFDVYAINVAVKPGAG